MVNYAKMLSLLLIPVALLSAFSFASAADKPHKSIVVAGGCFWCTEAMFRMVKGVTDVECAYAGGNRVGVTYEQVCSGVTGHAEAIKITYDPGVVSADDLLRLFFTAHDPTTKDQQGGDVGTQYRSVIFYTNEEEKHRAEKIIAELDREHIFKSKIVTTVEPLKNYTRAEDYHQEYFRKYEQATPEQRAHMNAGYCAAVISPKVSHFREKLKHLFKG